MNRELLAFLIGAALLIGGGYYARWGPEPASMAGMFLGLLFIGAGLAMQALRAADEW